MNIELEILQYSYWEHFKKAKDLALVLPVNHPERLQLQAAIDGLLAEINNIIK